MKLELPTHAFINKPCFVPRFARKLFPLERSDHVNLLSSRCVVPLLAESEKKNDNLQLLLS